MVPAGSPAGKLVDGDFSLLNEITEISQKKNAITILDDAHGDFVIGKEDVDGSMEFLLNNQQSFQELRV